MRRPEGHGWSAPVWLGVWFGLLAGLGEGLYVVMRGRLLLEPVSGFPEANRAVVWTIPLSLALTFGALGLVLALASRLWRRRPAERAAVALFAFLLTLSWVSVPARVHWIAALVLSLGVAVQVLMLASPRMGVFVPYVRRSVPRGVLLVVAIAVVQVGLLPLVARYRLHRAPAPESATNVVLIVLDTQRADHLALYGYDRPTSPELERLAGTAVTFDAAYSPSGWTFPSHASLFTGKMFPGQHLGSRLRNPLDSRETTLAETLLGAGYNTSAFAGNLLYANPKLGLGQGFLTWSGLEVSPWSVMLSPWLNRSVRKLILKLTGGPPFSQFPRSADDVNRAFLSWLDGRPAGRPFFTFLNYFDVHSPYGAPAPFAGRYRSDPKPLWLTKGTGSKAYTAAELARFRDAYDEEIAYLDSRMGELFDALAARGLLDSTVVVLTADHGEQFGEHGHLDHGQNIYTVLTHVPLMVWLPGGRQGGRRVGATVGTLDIAATVLDVLGIEGDVGGSSFTDLLGDDAARLRPAYSYTDGFRADRRSVVWNGWHYIETDSAAAELYYLPEDPGEVTDRIGSAPRGLLNELRGRMEVAFGAPEPGALVLNRGR
ncbi:MAG: sulfatase [Gemmatimonadota bacterium]|jgi:arylsulfatase A-like enzyme